VSPRQCRDVGECLTILNTSTPLQDLCCLTQPGRYRKFDRPGTMAGPEKSIHLLSLAGGSRGLQLLKSVQPEAADSDISTRLTKQIPVHTSKEALLSRYDMLSRMQTSQTKSGPGLSALPEQQTGSLMSKLHLCVISDSNHGLLNGLPANDPPPSKNQVSMRFGALHVMDRNAKQDAAKPAADPPSQFKRVQPFTNQHEGCSAIRGALSNAGANIISCTVADTMRGRNRGPNAQQAPRRRSEPGVNNHNNSKNNLAVLVTAQPAATLYEALSTTSAKGGALTMMPVQHYSSGTTVGSLPRMKLVPPHIPRELKQRRSITVEIKLEGSNLPQAPTDRDRLISAFEAIALGGMLRDARPAHRRAGELIATRYPDLPPEHKEQALLALTTEIMMASPYAAMFDIAELDYRGGLLAQITFNSEAPVMTSSSSRWTPGPCS